MMDGHENDGSSIASVSDDSSINVCARGDEEWNDWVDEGPDEVPTRCLLSDTEEISPEAALAADRVMGLDFFGLLNSHQLDLYGAMKLINFIRTLAKRGISAEDIVARVTDADSLIAALKDEIYLQPIIQEDPLLYGLGKLLEARGMDDAVLSREGDGRTGDESKDKACGNITMEAEGPDSNPEFLMQENESLRTDLREAHARLRRLSMLMAAVDDDVRVSSTPQAPDNDTYYFRSYNHHAIHETMLKDRVRTHAYRDAIFQAGMTGKVVLDVGAGSGVLSMFAAKAGADLVFGVDCSEIVKPARAIVQLNGMGHKVKLIQGKIEEIRLPVAEVDVIVSEWMGYCLLYESMLLSVLTARDKYLRPGGLMLPSRCSMVIQGVSDVERRLSWWSDVYGLDMSPLRAAVMSEPAVESVYQEAILTDAFIFKDFDLYTVKARDLDFEADFVLDVQASQIEPLPLCGLVVSFDTFFENLLGQQVVSFSTRPESNDTHWHQTLFWLSGAPNEVLTEGDTIKGNIGFRRTSTNHREYDVHISWEVRRNMGSLLLGNGQQSFTLGS